MRQAVGLIFSKDRAMQLDATVKSLFDHCKDSRNIDIKVIYAASNSMIKQQYLELANIYSEVDFISETNFQQQVLLSIVGYDYVLFLVDDNLFVRDFSIVNIMNSLNSNANALGFSLRLGTNTNYCYPLRINQQIPVFFNANDNCLKFDWTTAQYDFCYPLEVSSSVYRVKDITEALQKIFTNPNMLEANLNNSKMAFISKRYLLCNQYSCAFCNPVNKVQAAFNNRASDIFCYSPDELSEMFAQGYRINVEAYNDFIPNACHQEVELYFIKLARATEVTQKIEKKLPTVSVIMPVYNGEDYLRLAIESILTQTFTDFEFIVIDDGSTDNSLGIISSYLDPRIVIIKNQCNLNLVASLNKGLEAASGRYIARMDADDISLPSRLGKQVDFMEQHPEIGVLGTWVELFGACQGRGCYTDNPETAKCILLFGCPVAHPSVMIRKDILDSISYSSEYPHAEDYGLWVQLAKVHQISNLPEVLLKYRISPSQISSKYAKEQIETTIKIQREQICALGIRPTEEELSLHWIISKKHYLPADFIGKAAAWLNKLKAANELLHYYPEPQFTEILRVYWKFICQNLLKAI